MPCCYKYIGCVYEREVDIIGLTGARVAATKLPIDMKGKAKFAYVLTVVITEA